MTSRRTTLAAVVTAAAVAFAPAVAVATPSTSKPVKPKFVISKLSIIKYKKTVDVATKDRKVKFQVQVKDKSKRFDPSSVKLVVIEKVSGEAATKVVVNAKRVGKSKAVTNWRGTLLVEKGAVDPGQTATYCVKLVKVDEASSASLPVVKTAKGLAGRDCFKVVNTATA